MEDNIPEVSEDQVVDQVQENVEGTEEQISDIEQRALEMGWRPKSDFDGEEADFIDAKEFVRRKPLFDKIEHQSKELKEIRKVLRSLQDHHVKVKETEFQRAVDFLKVQKKQAYEEGDTDKIIEIDDQIAEMRESKRAQAQTVAFNEEAKQMPPEFAAWVTANPWYAQDKSLRTFADSLGVSHAQEFPDKTPQEVLQYVKSAVRRAYPDKFNNPNKTKPAAVDGGTSSTKVGSGTKFQLTADEERVMKQFERQGIFNDKFTKDMYIADVKRTRGE